MNVNNNDNSNLVLFIAWVQKCEYTKAGLSVERIYPNCGICSIRGGIFNFLEIEMIETILNFNI